MVDNPLGIDANRVKVGKLTGSMINPRGSAESAPSGWGISVSDRLANSLTAGGTPTEDNGSEFEREFYNVPRALAPSRPRAPRFNPRVGPACPLCPPAP